jgi:hypothetical protein
VEGLTRYTDNSFMALRKLGFTSKQHGWNPEVADNVIVVSHGEFQQVCERVYAIQRKFIYVALC